MASGASDASLHPRTAVFPGSAPQESAPVAEAQVDETGELSVTKTTAGDRGLETTDELVLRKKSWACRGRFKECLSVLNLVHHDWLEQRSAEFNWWTSGLNADKNGPGSLDARLSLRPDVTAVIVDALDGLEDALYTYHKLATSDSPSLTEADSDSTASDGLDRAPSPWSDMSSGGGEGPASAVGDGEEEDEEIEDAENQHKDAHLPLSSDDYVEQRAYIENNLVVLIRIHIAIKLSGLKLRNKRADDTLKQAKQDYERQKLTIGAHKALASQDGEHERFRRYLTKLVLRNGYTEDLIRGLSFRIYQLAEAERCQDVGESRDLEDSQDPESSQDARELNVGQIGESSEVLLQKKLLVVLRAYLCDPARLTTVQRRLIDANIVRRNRLIHAGSASKTSSHAPKGRTEPTPKIQPLNKSIAQRSSLMAENVTSSSYNLVSSTTSRPVTQSNQGSQATKSFVAQPATALESRFSITGALTPAVRSTARSAGTKMSARVGHLDYPSCPIKGDGPFPCDYCPMILPQEYREKEKWRGHVAQDLCGYVCVFEDCESPEDMFASTYEWMSHMARSHSEVEWVCPLCANHRFPADDTQAASFPVPSQLQDHILACHPAIDADGGLAELELVVSAGQRAVGIRKVRCPLCRPGLVTSEEDIDGSVVSPLPVGQAAGLVQLEEDQHIATHIHEFALHGFPSADGEELPEEARESVPSEPSTRVDMNIERLRRPKGSFQGQAFAYTIEDTQDAIEELNATFLQMQASDWIQAESSVLLGFMGARLDNLIPSLQLAQREVDLDGFAWELNECQILVSQLSDISPNSDKEGSQVIELLEELDEKLRQLTSLCETGRQREGQQLPPQDLPFDRKKLSQDKGGSEDTDRLVKFRPSQVPRPTFVDHLGHTVMASTDGRCKTYHVVPRFDLAAEGGQLFLGGVYQDLNILKPAINRREMHRLPIPEDLLYPSVSQKGFRETRASIREGSFDAWVKILGCLGVGSTGGSATIAGSRDNEDTVACEEIETTYFDPDDSFVLNSFNIDPVKRYLEGSRHRTATLYIVTGIKIAKGLDYNKSNNTRGQIGAQVAIDGAHSGVAEASTAANLSGENDHNLEFAVASDIIIGFRVNKFRCIRRVGFGKKDRKVKDDGVLTGAMMANDNDNVRQEYIEVEALAMGDEDSAIPTTASDQSERCVVPDSLKQMAGLV